MPASPVFVIILRLDGLFSLTYSVPEPLGNVKLPGKLQETNTQYTEGYFKANYEKNPLWEQGISAALFVQS